MKAMKLLILLLTITAAVKHCSDEDFHDCSDDCVVTMTEEAPTRDLRKLLTTCRAVCTAKCGHAPVRPKTMQTNVSQRRGLQEEDPDEVSGKSQCLVTSVVDLREDVDDIEKRVAALEAGGLVSAVMKPPPQWRMGSSHDNKWTILEGGKSVRRVDNNSWYTIRADWTTKGRNVYTLYLDKFNTERPDREGRLGFIPVDYTRWQGDINDSGWVVSLNADDRTLRPMRSSLGGDYVGTARLETDEGDYVNQSGESVWTLIIDHNTSSLELYNNARPGLKMKYTNVPDMTKGIAVAISCHYVDTQWSIEWKPEAAMRLAAPQWEYFAASDTSKWAITQGGRTVKRVGGNEWWTIRAKWTFEGKHVYRLYLDQFKQDTDREGRLGFITHDYSKWKGDINGDGWCVSLNDERTTLRPMPSDKGGNYAGGAPINANSGDYVNNGGESVFTLTVDHDAKFLELYNDARPQFSMKYTNVPNMSNGIAVAISCHYANTQWSLEYK